MADCKFLQSAISAALHLLSFRPRSEVEVRRRLITRFASDIINRVIEVLIKQNMVDDYKFATLWRNNRLSFGPRSATRISQELIQKGVCAEIAASVVKDVDDTQTAYSVALNLARKLHLLGPADLHSKIQEYLKRRGYTDQIIQNSIVRLHNKHRHTMENPDIPDDN